MASRLRLHSSGVVTVTTCSHVVCVILLHFLVAFAQGQGPGMIEMSVVEESPVGTVVGSVDAVPNYIYTFQDPTSQFEINRDGVVRTLQVVDRDELPNSVIRLYVIGNPVNPQDKQLTFNVAITVLDLNDNSPQFYLDDTPAKISFQEDAREGRKNIVTATDRDEGANGTIRGYEIVSGNDAGMFGLDFSGLPLILYIYKKGVDSFDREKLDHYQLNISAWDGGVPPKYGFLLVDISILDVNDNTPAFDLSEYTIQVNESVPVGTSVFHAEATDYDQGLNGEIIYRLEDETNQFRIDENTGVIETVTSPLMCSRRCGRSTTKCNPNSCFILVAASDKGLNALTGRTYVYVEVLDENNHDPVIKFSKDTSEITVASVDENASVQTVVFTVSVSDEDSGANGETSVKIIKGNEEGYFTHFSVPSYGINEIQVSKQLDRETISKFNLTFEAVDNGTPKRSSTAFIIILVNDANDHAPEFEKTSYQVSLSEFSKPHSFVSSLRATDKDEGVNSKLTYEIASGNEALQWFSIDADTGLVTTVADLDHEETSQVVLNISAHDGGADPKYNFATLTIDILDENDYAPRFSKESYLQELTENRGSGAEIVTLRTVDRDSGNNGSVEYLIHPDTEIQYPQAFAVDRISGKLTSQQRFDREETDHYLIKVIAHDKGPNSLSSTATIELSIKDVNDNRPKFSPREYYVNVFDNDPAGLQVIRVVANDKDIGDFGKVSYSMRDPYNSFKINSDSGVISTYRQLQKQKYILIITAVDGGGTSSDSDAKVNVIVISMSSVAPEFTQSSYDFAIAEDNGELSPQIGRPVGRVEASSTAGRPVTYAITGGDREGMFKIDSSSGTIRTQVPIDREEKASYALTVIAYDGEKISSRKVTVTVNDLNDNAPRFVTHTTEATVLENWPVGHNIFLAQAIDSDAGVNKDVSYSLTSTDETNGVFAINSDTGVLYLAKPPNEMPSSTATLTVTATDAGSTQKASSMNVKVKIEDVNDHTPQFNQSHFELFLPESQQVNQIVKVMSATDEDLGRNGELTYAITRGNDDRRFGIFPDGSIYVAHSLDREIKDMYSLTVLVRDNGKEPRRSSVNITIFIQDENDNEPKFTQEVFEFSVMENSKSHTYIGTIKAVDKDIGRNAEILYSLGDSNVNFSIDPIMGTIFSKKEFDREYVVKTTNVAYYQFDAFATDNGLSKLQSKVTIKVNILDENDNPPVFTQAPDPFTVVDENRRIDDVVFTVLAVDADEDANAALSYSIVSGNEAGKFGIHAANGQLFLKDTLDREFQDQYLLTIKATDTGPDIQQEATTPLRVYVVDFNDNTPEFAKDTPSFIRVSETTRIGETLVTFSGTDKDIGNNGKLRFDIVSGNEDDIFVLGMLSGKLSLARNLDYEANNSGVHSLNITLSDSGYPALSVAIIFSVQVIDANDNAPIFKDGLSIVYAKENKNEGAGIATVSATDKDSGDMGRVRYSIYKQTPGGDHFVINPTSGEITLNALLDREVFDSFKVTIHATDQDPNVSQRKTSEKSLTIIVNDVNDNAPVFQSPSVFLVPSSVSEGTTVASVEATDLDQGDNSKITYSFSGQTPSLFNLNPTTGTISLAQSLPVGPFSFTLSVVATDGGSSPKSSQTTISLLLYTSSGNGPMFASNNPKSGTISENTNSGTSIMRLNASPSSSNVRVEYYITKVASSGTSYGGLFTIDRSSGVISAMTRLDREQLVSDTFQVDVIAVEKGDGQRATTTQVTIVVEDENDNAPAFASTLFDVSISENVSPGSSVAWIVVTDPDIAGNLVFSLTGQDAVKFRIEQNGTLYTTQQLDHEKDTFYAFTVKVNDGIHESTAAVHINVLDENDHSPSFGKLFYSFNVFENAAIGHTVGTVEALDADSGNNGRVVYELKSEWGQDYFELDEILGTFILKKELDFEERQLYTLKVIARDEGRDQRSTEVKVYINVKDVNDNQPEFDPMSYYKEISEDAPVGTPVVNVSATDVDSGRSGDIRYSLLSESAVKFGIGPINGSVYTTGPLDREEREIYNVIVMATDQAVDIKDRMSTTTTVEVKLRDVNDSPPVFKSPDVIEIMENAEIGSTVFTVMVEDLDEGVNSDVTFRLISPSSIFTIESNSGALVLRSELDRETVTNHTLVIECKDGGSPRNSAEQTLLIKVADANDNAPKFTQDEYGKTVPENVIVGTSLLRIVATDKDEGFNGAVRYFIIGGEGSHDFHLDMSSGVLRVQKSLDYERVKSYAILVQAEDSSVENPLHTNATIVITVTDENDFVPVFDDSPYHTFVQEGMRDEAVPVITLKARDEDSGNNGVVQYSLRDITSYTNLFDINGSTGEMVVLKSLDRETTPLYVLTVVAMDRGSPIQMGTATVTVFVKDVNDHTPVFESNGPYMARVMENLPADTPVVTVSATDMDEGMNSQIVYSLVDNMGSRFTIHPSSGQILTTGSLDRELESSFTLTVVATDQGIPPRMSSVQVNVLVDDDNDHAPEFGTNSYTATMYDSSNTADFVIGVTAVDQDIGNNGKVHYTLEGADEAFFHINSDTGVVTHATSLTGAGRTFNFVVRASDLGKIPLNSTASVVVNLASATNTNRPKFNDLDTNPTITENANIGDPLTTVKAVTPTGSRVTYHIAGGNVNNGFTVNSDTGSITVAGRIDYEVTNMFHLWLEAREQGSSQLSTFQQLAVTVRDENDNDPVFSDTFYSAEIDENCPVDTTVIQVQATDQDSGSNQQIAYKIKNGNENNTFAVDSSSGLVKTINKVVDREKIALFNLEIEAADMGSRPRSSTTTVRIIIRDMNDNEPTFTGPRSVAVPEDLPIGSFIMQLTTNDLDIGENAQATFRFETNQNQPLPFAIDPSSGNITNIDHLDAESQHRYSFSVTVTDGSFIQRTTLTVRVLDINDNPPRFQNSFLVFNFSELQPPNTRVAQLNALDLDKSSPNNKSFFSLKRPSSLFELNSENGQILALETMYFYGGQSAGSTMNDHILDVVATDLGIPSLSSEATLLIRITDANDHPPVFLQQRYFSAVPQNLQIDQKILQVVAKDEMDYGKNAEVTYRIISGNGMPFFKIDADTGDIFPRTSLSGKVDQKFSLVVRARDRGLPAMSGNTNVELEITEVNVNTPSFNSNIFQKQVDEDVQIGFVIDTITATDNDRGWNAEIEYHITAGNDEELFAIDQNNGTLRVNGQLDYETQTTYTIVITARDKALFYKEVSRDYQIILRDVNDNKPVFDSDYYDAYIKENSELSSSVFRISATDADTSPSNSEISYSIVGESNSKNYFRINEQTGEITTHNHVFDYEQRTLYTLLVMAFNPDQANDVLKSVATVYVHVTGENEDRPKFVKKYYGLEVSESAEMGTSLGRITAVDNDKGVDGIVYYYLEGQSNLRGFSIEPLTGTVRVSKRPDYESSPHIILTAIAKNWGSVSGNDTDTCTINITVSDANDPPEFSRSVYPANITENSDEYTLVTFVYAEDKDIRPENKEFAYEILSGNKLGKFQILPSGKIETTGLGVLDRETMSRYTLIVGARDTRQPNILGSATVIIELTDVNDNGPRFNPQFLRANVSENETAGQEVIVLKDYTFDADLPPNQGPYRYRMVDGPWADFFAISEMTGRVETKRVLNRDSHKEFVIAVVVTDSGSPKMTSTLSFTVVVNDINNSQPKPRPLTVMVGVPEGPRRLGKIADVRPLDSDQTDKFTCSIISSDTGGFLIDTACDLQMVGNLPPETYKLRIRGSDEKFPPVEYDVTVVVEVITNSSLDKSVAVVLRNERASSFLERKYQVFKRQVEEAFGTSFTCKIYSLKEDTGDLLVMLYVHDRSERFLSSDDIQRGLTDAKGAIEGNADVSILTVASSRCSINPCQNGGVCSTVVVWLDGSVIFDSPSIVLTSPSTDLTTSCFCPATKTGPFCELSQDPCGADYCKNGGECVNAICECPDTWYGDYCQTDVNECRPTSPCKNGATCRNTDGSFECDCLTGYHGKYCESQNFCTSKPCSHGTCEELQDSFQCHCDYGYHGSRCQFASMSFQKGSYALFKALDSYHIFNITMYFATVDANALLVFSPVTISGGDKGFVAMEIVDSKLKVSLQLEPAGNRPQSRVVHLETSDAVNTGYWYRVEFTKVTRTANMIVQKCTGSSCQQCADKRPGCYSEDSFVSDNLPIQGQYVSLGGVRDFSDILDQNGLVSTHDFRGCIHSVSINGKAFGINSVDSGDNAPIDAFNVTDTCPRTQAVDSCSDDSDDHTCYNGGICIDEWSHMSCKCSSDYMDDVCLIKRQPFSLGSNAVVKYSLNPSYVRDMKLGALRSRRRRAVGDSSVMIRFRSTTDQGMLFSSKTDTVSCLLWFANEEVNFLLKTGDSVNDPLSLPAKTINDGGWHNVTVMASGTVYKLDLDGEDFSSKDFGIPFDFDSLDVVEMTISGKATMPDNTEVDGLDGCLSQFNINGESLPLNGSTVKYDIKAIGDVEGKCGALCSNNPCGGDNKCVVDGEAYKCLLVAGSPAGLETGIIVVIVFFAILLIAIVVVFVLFRTRRDLFHRCVRGKKQNQAGGSSSNGKVQVNVDNIIPAGGMNGSGSRYGLHPSEEEMIIRNHIVENLAGQKTSSLTARPDLIGSSYSPQPLQLSDGTVIMETSDMNTMVGEEDVPEHYDFENASSIAPSDIAPSDMIRHYRDFRNGTHHHHHHHHHHIHQQPGQQTPLNNSLFNKYRDSPANVSNSHYRASPNIGPPIMHQTRQSPISLTGSALSVPANHSPMLAANGGRPSSALATLNQSDGSRARMSPLTQLNVRSPRTHPHNYSSNNNNNSRSNSTQSIGSHHSHSSSSSATGVPSGLIPPYAVSSHKHHNNKPIPASRSRTPKGLTVEDVNRLNARPDLNDPVSMMDVASSSIDGHPRLNAKHHILPQEPVLDSSILLEPPDSSSDDSGANDSFTCSEFEYDNDNARTRLDLESSKMIFSKLTEVENETDDIIPQHQNQNGKLSSNSDGLNSNGDSFASTNASSSGSPSSPNALPALKSQYDFDALLNWGPNFDKLVGVFKDIAQLPDTGQKLDGATDHDYEEYV